MRLSNHEKNAMKILKFFAYLALIICIVYGVFLLLSTKRFDVTYGISFSQNHASDLGLDWKKVYVDMLSELKPKYIRVAAMWNDVEAEQGEYNFSNVDFMMDRAKDFDTKVVLVVGQKAPRWPECHIPDWVEADGEVAHENLLAYVKAVTERYKDHGALEIWQVENEPFITFKFGKCKKYEKSATYEEVALVKSIDAVHKTIVTDSGELSTWARASRAGDLFGSTLYRIVQTPGGTRFSYGFLPAGFYRAKARMWGRGYDDFFISELQAEPWFTDSNPWSTPVDEQEKTMNIERLAKHFDYVERVGASRAYLWGVEWWYFMKEYKADARYWDAVKEKMKE